MTSTPPLVTSLGDAVVVAQQDRLRSLVAEHRDLCWSDACEKLSGSYGVVAAVDDADGTVKLEPVVDQPDGSRVCIEVTQWLPRSAVSAAESNLESLRLAIQEAWKPPDPPPPPPSEKDVEQRAKDDEWSAKSGRKFPFDLVITAMNGQETRVRATSLSNRFDDIRQEVAWNLNKAKEQIKLSINQEVLPPLGKLERIADHLAETTCLDLIIVKRQLTSPVVKRLRREETDFQREACNFELVSMPDPDVEPMSDKWEATIRGPAGSPYEGGTFKLSLKIPADYPFRPPKVKFITKIWMPHVHPSSGMIDLDILGDKWSPALSLAKVVMNVIHMLEDPSDDACVNQEALQQIQQCKETFTEQAQEWTKIYAQSGAVPSGS